MIELYIGRNINYDGESYSIVVSEDEDFKETRTIDTTTYEGSEHNMETLRSLGARYVNPHFDTTI